MNQQDYTGYIQSTSEQAQSHGQVQSGSERAQFGSGQVQSGSEKAQSSSTSMAVQMLKNKNKPREEIKPVDQERQKIDKDKDVDSDKDKDSDLDSFEDFVYVQKPKTNRIRCEECDEQMTRKNYNRHIQLLKHKKNEQMYNRNKIIESANEDGIKVTNEDIEQRLDEQYIEEGIKFCDSCDMYLDNNTAYNKHVTTLKHRNNIRLVTGEIVKNGSKFDCVICSTSLSQYSVDQHLKTKMHLDNVEGKDKDIDKNITEGYCNICNNRYNNKNEHNESDEHKENVNQKKLVDGKWRDKVNELGLDHNMKHNQIIITSSSYEDPKFLNILESLHNIHPHIKFNTFDIVKYTKPTDDKLEENEFTFRLMTRQYNSAHDLDLLNGELETRMQEQEMNQSGWSMQRFVKRTMYIHRSYPSGGCDTALPFTSRYILNIHNTDNKCLLWCLIAYLHSATHNPSRVNNYNKPEYINEIKLPIGVTHPYDYYHLKKMQELNKDKILFNVFNLNKNKTIYPVLINHDDPKGCNILYWDNHYFLRKDVSFLLRKSSKHICYPCLKCCVSFRTEDALNKHLELCNTQKYVGRRTFHKDDYLKFDKFHYKNRVPFAMYYDFEYIIKDGKHFPIACGLYIKSDYPDILEDKYECNCGDKVVDWFVERIDYYNKLFKDI